jgi:hypothetical protein
MQFKTPDWMLKAGIPAPRTPAKKPVAADAKPRSAAKPLRIAEPDRAAAAAAAPDEEDERAGEAEAEAEAEAETPAQTGRVTGKRTPVRQAQLTGPRGRH